MTTPYTYSNIPLIEKLKKMLLSYLNLTLGFKGGNIQPKEPTNCNSITKTKCIA